MFNQIQSLTAEDLLWLGPVIYFAFYINLAIHELGHYMVGHTLLNRYIKIKRFRVGSYITLYHQKHGETFFVIKLLLWFPLGAYVKATPRTSSVSSIPSLPWLLFLSGGVISNVILGLSLLCLGNLLDSLAIIIVAIISIIIGLSELIPLKGTDGHRLYQAFFHKIA